MNCVKKLLSVFLGFLSVTVSFGLQKSFATKDYQVHVAVFCKNKDKAHDMIKSLCYRKGTFNAIDRRVYFTDKSNDALNSTVIYDSGDDVNYHVVFHYLPQLDKRVLSECSEAIILYDISDQSLDPIITTADLSSQKNIKELLSINVPLIKYINKLQYNKFVFVFPGWYNSLDFVSYGKQNLTSEVYDKRRSKLNRFTCNVEKYFNIDNKWGRGHPDISNPNFYEYTLLGIVGSAYTTLMHLYLIN